MKVTFIALLSIFFWSCEKQMITRTEEIQTETFYFKTASYTTSMCSDTTQSNCINGWKTYGHDTTYFESEIQLIDSNMFYMKLTDKNIQGYNDTVFVAENGDISCPTYPIGGHYSFQGKYINNDSIAFKIVEGGGIGGYFTFEINGTKID